MKKMPRNFFCQIWTLKVNVGKKRSKQEPTECTSLIPGHLVQIIRKIKRWQKIKWSIRLLIKKEFNYLNICFYIKKVSLKKEKNMFEMFKRSDLYCSFIRKTK